MSDLISLVILPIVPPSGLKGGCDSGAGVGLIGAGAAGEGLPLITPRINNV